MDVVSMVRPYSMAFLVLAVLFGGIAAGLVPAPASGTGAYSDVQVTGGGVESALWSFNPVNKTWHFEITAGASSYNLVIGLPETEVSGADGKYRVAPYKLSVDLSGVQYALPMEEDPSRTVYAYKFVDCGTTAVPYNIWVDVLSKVGNILTFGASGSVYDWLHGDQVKSVYRQAYESCKNTLENTASSLNVKSPVYYILLSADSRTEKISIFGADIYTVKVYDPHFYGLIKYRLDTWSPKVSGEMYPVGVVRVTLLGEKGASTVQLTLSGSSKSEAEGGVIASARLPIGGSISYMGYFRSTGDVYHLPDPWVINYNGRYVAVSSSDLQGYFDIARGIEDYLSSGAAKDYLVNSFRSFDEFLQSVGNYGMAHYAEESVSVRNTIQQDYSNLEAKLKSVVDGSPWARYVYSSGDIASPSELLLKPPSGGAGSVFKLKLKGDVPAEWLGLEELRPVGKIVDFPRQGVDVSRSGGVSFQFTVKNVGESPGAIQWSVTCGPYGILGSGVTQDVPVGSTATVPVSGVLQGLSNYSEPKQVKCTITVGDTHGDITDSAVVYLNYKPEVVCAYTIPTCSVVDGVEGYYYCESPYKPAAFKQCPAGQVCKMGENGAKCVVPDKRHEENVTVTGPSFCSGSQICYISDGEKVCQDCPNGGSCTYVRGEGAKCTGEKKPVPPPTPGVVKVSPVGGSVELWRVGAGLAAVGSLLIWVVLA